jgi:hypothetical protein
MLSGYFRLCYHPVAQAFWLLVRFIFSPLSMHDVTFLFP